MVDQGSIYLNGLNKTAFALHPSSQVDSHMHSLLLQAIERLWDARQERLLAAQTTIPGVVWFVVIVGGALTIAFGSFLGASSLRLKLAMSAALGRIGADTDCRPQQPIPRQFPGLDRAIRAGAVADGRHGGTTIIPSENGNGCRGRRLDDIRRNDDE